VRPFNKNARSLSEPLIVLVAAIWIPTRTHIISGHLGKILNKLAKERKKSEETNSWDWAS
jgi:hypothetical protein